MAALAFNEQRRDVLEKDRDHNREKKCQNKNVTSTFQSTTQRNSTNKMRMLRQLVNIPVDTNPRMEYGLFMK